MKKSLIGKPACIAALAVLIIISIAEIILRGVILKGASLDIANAGEPIITALFSLMLLVFAAKGKDRVFYILCGAFLFYFVLNQLFGLPGIIATLISYDITQINGFISYLLQAISMLCFIGIGALLVEYMNDGSIYNKAFNAICLFAVVLFLFFFLHGLYDVFAFERTYAILVSLNALSRMAILFLCVFFAYDAAKKQLAKTKL